MKERIYIGTKPTAVLEVCDCQGELQLRLYNGEPWPLSIVAGPTSAYPHAVRVKLGPADVERLFEFFDDLTVDMNDVKGGGDAA